MSSKTSKPDPKYRLEIDRDVEKAVRRQDRTTKARLFKAIFALAENPHPRNSLKLEGYIDLFRLRVGDWRIIYQIKDDQLLIIVLEVGSRGDIYRGY